MCGHCGCGEGEAVIRRPGAGVGEEDRPSHHPHPHHHHPHPPEHRHVANASDGTSGPEERLEARILAENDRLAARNRAFFAGREILAVNLLGGPGAGKTTLLEALVPRLGPRVPVFVVEGDQATDRDGARIRAAGAPVVQVNTGTGCHLDAAMVARAVAELAPTAGSWLMIENVGNLVCPALFDLGESVRLVLASPTEGEDKPLKYPHIFRSADLVLLAKADLLGPLGFDRDAFAAALDAVAPGCPWMEICAPDGTGLEGLIGWLEERHRRIRARAPRVLLDGEVGR